MLRNTLLSFLVASTLWPTTGSIAQDKKSTASTPTKTASTKDAVAKDATATKTATTTAATDSSSATPYTVKDGTKVDERTLEGWKTWRALACERCHGSEQEGLVGPSLVDRLKVLSKEDFHQLMMHGRPEKGMPNFNGSSMVQKNWEGLYGYLKGRSDGQIKPGRLEPLAP